MPGSGSFSLSPSLICQMKKKGPGSLSLFCCLHLETPSFLSEKWFLGETKKRKAEEDPK
jgi:hypothetical protein